MIVIGFILEVGGNIEQLIFAFSVGIELEHLHFNNVDDLIKTDAVIDGELHDSDLRAEAFLKLFESIFEHGVFGVEFIYNENYVIVIILCKFKASLRSHFNTLERVNHHQSGFGDS